MKKAGIFFAIMILFVPSLVSLDLKGIDASLGIISYGYTGETRYTSSPLKSSLEIGFQMPLRERFEFRPELSLFYFDYVWDESEERAVPAAIETADRISVFHFLINPTFLYIIPVNQNVEFGISAGTALLFRLPLIAIDNGDEYREEISSYLYSSARFFYPSLGGLFRWRFSEGTALNLNARAYIPLFHLWDGSEEPFNDQLIIGLSAGFLFSL